jgi:hypothetical protein
MNALLELEMKLRRGDAHPPPLPAYLAKVGVELLSSHECVYSADHLVAQTQWRWALPGKFSSGYVKLALSDNQAALRPLPALLEGGAASFVAAAPPPPVGAPKNLAERPSSYVTYACIVF